MALKNKDHLCFEIVGSEKNATEGKIHACIQLLHLCKLAMQFTAVLGKKVYPINLS